MNRNIDISEFEEIEYELRRFVDDLEENLAIARHITEQTLGAVSDDLSVMQCAKRLSSSEGKIHEELDVIREVIKRIQHDKEILIGTSSFDDF